MANGKLLRQLVRSGADGDVEAFRDVAKELVAEECQEHHHPPSTIATSRVRLA